MIGLYGCTSRVCQCGQEDLDEQQEDISYAIDFRLPAGTYDEYKSYKGFIPKEGMVPTAEVAYQITRAVVESVYKHNVIDNKKPFSIAIEKGVWIVEGFFYDPKGDKFHIEIQKKDGTVLKLLHSKDTI